MNIATILFTYNRSEHTKRVLDALSRNTLLPQKLYVFQDGLRSGGNRDGWERVSAMIKQIDFCSTEVHVSAENKGLAKSIVSGINYAFAGHDAVIVLEDDCVPMPGFMRFMTQCFETYEKDKDVYSLSGYAWPIAMKSDRYDAYFCGRISSWGWGTWKDRWSKFERNYDLLNDIRNDEEASIRLSQWGGKDTLPILLGNIVGNINSWAIFWNLRVFADNGLCINPYLSLIDNIGCDGSGEHCGSSDIARTQMQEKEIEEFSLPPVCIEEKVRYAFQQFYGDYFHKDGLPKALIWGIGNLYNRHKKDLLQKVTVVAFLDTFKKFKYFEGKKIIREEEIPKYKFEKIIIEIENLEEARKVKGHLIKEYGIREDCILIDL